MMRIVASVLLLFSAYRCEGEDQYTHDTMGVLKM